MNLRKIAPVLVALAIIGILTIVNSAGVQDGTSVGVEDGTSVNVKDGTSGVESQDLTSRFSDLAVVTIAELPLEVLDTLDLIDAGGPYPFDRDDLTFQNREALLPDRPRGHYREYTVITPGENDRGARRIVAGADGELYYTADHYDSFREIVS